MNNNSDKHDVPLPRRYLDPDYEPRTIPANWDLSAMETTAISSRAGSFDEKSPESFPKTRTVPTNWDLSSLS